MVTREERAEITRKELERKRQSMATFRSSETNEWYTPTWLMQLVTSFYPDGIILDPATSELAQSWIKSEYYWTFAFTQAIGFNPLLVDWDVSRDETTEETITDVWLNPPYGNEGKLWILKAVREYRRRNIRECLLLVKGDSIGIKTLRKEAIFLEFSRRIAFIDAVGKKANSTIPGGVRLYYLGERRQEFIRHFGSLGDVFQIVNVDNVRQ